MITIINNSKLNNFAIIKLNIEQSEKDNVNKKEERNNTLKENNKSKVYKCKREPIYATPPVITYELNAPAPLDSHSQQTSTPKIKDFLRNSLSQHNKFCYRNITERVCDIGNSTIATT